MGLSARPRVGGGPAARPNLPPGRSSPDLLATRQGWPVVLRLWHRSPNSSRSARADAKDRLEVSMCFPAPGRVGPGQSRSPGGHGRRMGQRLEYHVANQVVASMLAHVFRLLRANWSIVFLSHKLPQGSFTGNALLCER